MKRRDFLGNTLGGLVCLSAQSFSTEKQIKPKWSNRASDKPKNIIFITFDELGAGFFNCYGSGVNSTPTIDRLAQQGVRFTRCYATSPVCAPDRATWLTGRSPVIHGIIFNNLALANDMPTYPYILQQHGYHTGLFGKVHQTPMSLREPDNYQFLGFDEAVVTEDDKWGPWIDWIQQEHPEYLDAALALAWGGPQHKRHFTWVDRQKKAKEQILKPIQENSFWSPAYESPLPAELHDSTFITNSSLEFIEKHLKDHPDQPFMCHISYVDPHDPYNPPKPYSTMFNPDDMPDAIPQKWDPKRLKMLAMTQNHLDIKNIKDDPDSLRRLRALFHGSIKFLDDQVARIDRFLKDHKLWNNTIVVISTDHGEMMGDHGLITKGAKPYDSGIRIPLIISGVDIDSFVTDRLTCTLDFYPSICDWADIPLENRPPLEGKSFANIHKTGSDENKWSEIAVEACEVGGGVVTVITDDGWRLTRYAGEPAGQMFNLNQDPDEQNDLYHNLKYVTKRQELLERLVEISTRPHRIPQYRNMPLFKGQKYMNSYKNRGSLKHGGVPVYTMPLSPALTGQLNR
jgi:arylsulfatase A-like enzyme